MKKKLSGGRPPKFNEESGPITVTLPRRTLHNLEAIDMDRAKAIVKCVDHMIQQSCCSEKKVEVIEIEKGTGLIVVGPSQKLRDIPWLRLIEIAPCRFLLAIPSGTAIETLEIAIMDQIENLPDEMTAEKTLLTDLRQKISHHRRKDGVSKGEILYVDTDPNG
jgi:hypothetical protein